MRALAGQAARHTGRLLHALVQLAVVLVVLALVAVAGLSWRLSQGPLHLAWLAQRLEAAANAEAPIHLAIGEASLAWEGFREGLDKPLDIRLSNVTLADASGGQRIAIPGARVSLSAASLLLGRIVPRAFELDGARLHLTRMLDGAVTLDLGTLADSGEPAPAVAPQQLLRDLARAPVGDQGGGHGGRWSQLRQVRLRDAAVTLDDRLLRQIWRVPALSLDLERPPAGGIAGRAAATLALGTATATLALTATLPADGRRTALTATLSPLVPAELANLLPQLAPLSAVALPVTLSGSLDLDAHLQPETFSAQAEFGAGGIKLGTGSLPLLGATMTAAGTPDNVQVRLERLDLAAHPDGPHTTVRAKAAIARTPAGPWHMEGALELDAIAFADLPGLWPAGVGGSGARPWILHNITDGTGRNGHVALTADLPADLSDVTVTRVSGGLDGENLTVHWLRPVPPIEHADGHLTIRGADTLEATFSAGQQAGGSQGGIRIRNGHVTFIGLNAPEQFADIDGDLTGPIADAVALLRLPKVGLLAKTPLDLRDASGQVSAKVTVTRLPLRDSVTMDDVAIKVAAQLTAAHVGGIAAGRDLDRGALTLDASPDGLHLAGNAVVAGVPAQLQVAMDFRAGPPSQVLRTVTASGDLDARTLAGFGLETSGLLSGTSSVTGTLSFRRDGMNSAVLKADMKRAEVRVDPLGFVKPAGQPAALEATLALDGDRLTAVNRLTADGNGFRVDASAAFAGGKPSLLRLQRLALGSTTDLHGEVRPPASPGAAWQATLAGPSLDISGLIGDTPRPKPKPSGEPPPGPPYAVDARFDRVVLGAAGTLGEVVVHAENDGRVMHRVALSGRTGTVAGAGAFRLAIAPQGQGRTLEATGADAGGLLRAMEILPNMEGGTMKLSGRYDDTIPSHPLEGHAEITDFRIRHAPALAKLLQAMTLYGLVEMMSGPGLGFSELQAPFRLAGDDLELRDARAFNASLGMTVKGQVDLARSQADLAGTIVPAYFFNSLLGDIPLVGRLFSPERGGGLFAATYTVRGQLDDPSVSVNPLAALTPGFLRGMFGMFDAATPVAPTSRQR